MQTALVEKTVHFFNGLPRYFFLLAILLLYFFRFELDINEDHYMLLAKQFYDPDWVPASFTFNEFAGPRVLYQYLTGFLLEFLSFEMVAALGKVLLCVALCFPLSKLYQLFNFTNIDILLHLPILYLPRQSFVGEEVIFLSFEPKVFAYVFAFFAIYYLLIEKYRLATLFLILSTWFHLLVGGWIIAYFGLYHLVRERSIKKTLLLGLIYLAGMLPFLIYLLPSLTGNFNPAATPVGLDWIYTHFLKPHHTAIWVDTAYFLKGFLICTTFFLLCLFVFNKFEHELNRKINLWNILIFAGTFFSIILAWFDHSGFFVKYFPFLIYLQVVLLLRQFFLKESVVQYFQFGILIYFILVVFTKTGKHLALDWYAWFTDRQKDPNYLDMTDYIAQNTQQYDVLLLLPKLADPDDYYSYDMDTEIVRWTRRSRFVAFHAAPVSPGTDKLYQWYQRINAKKEIIQDPNKLCTLDKQFKIDYILTDYQLAGDSCYQLQYKNEMYFLYQIE